VKRALILVALVACNVDIDPPWQLAHDRIIAVRADPPGIASGQQSRIDLLVGFETQPVATRAPDVAMIVSPESMADVMAVEAGSWIVTAPGDERIAAARAELGLPPEAPVPLRVGVAAAWPNPVMSPNPAGFGAIKTVWLGESRPNPELVGLLINGVEPPPEGETIVVPKDTSVPLYIEADDSKDIVNWLTSCGEMHDFDLHAAYLTVGPDDPQLGEIAVVLRDERGGVVWRVWPIRAE
jgi:hypothetical protein